MSMGDFIYRILFLMFSSVFSKSLFVIAVALVPGDVELTFLEDGNDDLSEVFYTAFAMSAAETTVSYLDLLFAILPLFTILGKLW